MENNSDMDRWRHRSQEMRCGSCMYYVSKNAALGRCRRHAPTMAGWPAMFPEDWCGDHKLDETRMLGEKQRAETVANITASLAKENG